MRLLAHRIQAKQTLCGLDGGLGFAGLGVVCHEPFHGIDRETTNAGPFAQEPLVESFRLDIEAFKQVAGVKCQRLFQGLPRLPGGQSHEEGYVDLDRVQAKPQQVTV